MVLQKLRPLHIEHGMRSPHQRTRRGQRRVRARTIGHAHRLLSHAISDAAENELVFRNVMQSKSAPKVVDEEKTIVQDVAAFIAENKASRPAICPGHGFAVYRHARSEVLALRWGRIDLERKTISARGARGHQGSRHSFQAAKIQGRPPRHHPARLSGRCVARPSQGTT